MKILKALSLSTLLDSFLFVGCTQNDSSSSQSSGESGNENPSDLPWIS